MKKYSIVYADPPWKQTAGRKMNGYKVVNGKQIWNSQEVLSSNLPYKTMTVDEICEMPVKHLAEAHSVLFIWVTNKYMPDVFRVIESWGFKYSFTITWAKNKMGGGLGGTCRVTAEYLIMAKRGSLKAIGIIPGTWFNVKRHYKNGYPNHSSKPEFFRKLIESAYAGEKLELFARNETEGWDVFGNEVNNSIVID